MGEASVIQLAIEQSIIDELKGRRIAIASGLNVTGALGLLGCMKHIGIISSARPYIERATKKGNHYHPDLVNRFLKALDE
ncbi:MAG: DUF3368 domain-containing protein [Methylococcaceae bacterium]